MKHNTLVGIGITCFGLFVVMVAFAQETTFEADFDGVPLTAVEVQTYRQEVIRVSNVERRRLVNYADVVQFLEREKAALGLAGNNAAKVDGAIQIVTLMRDEVIRRGEVNVRAVSPRVIKQDTLDREAERLEAIAATAQAAFDADPEDKDLEATAVQAGLDAADARQIAEDFRGA